MRVSVINFFGNINILCFPTHASRSNIFMDCMYKINYVTSQNLISFNMEDPLRTCLFIYI
jgi:hypothetical protein